MSISPTMRLLNLFPRILIINPIPFFRVQNLLLAERCGALFPATLSHRAQAADGFFVVLVKTLEFVGADDTWVNSYKSHQMVYQ